METINQIIANNLRRLREEYGLSQKALADILEVKQQTVYNYEKGYRQIPTSVLDVLCKYFGLSPGYFLYNEDLEEAFHEIPLNLQEALYIASQLPREKQNEIVNFISYLSEKKN